jgi:hypothetical protein
MAASAGPPESAWIGNLVATRARKRSARDAGEFLKACAGLSDPQALVDSYARLVRAFCVRERVERGTLESILPLVGKPKARSRLAAHIEGLAGDLAADMECHRGRARGLLAQFGVPTRLLDGAARVPAARAGEAQRLVPRRLFYGPLVSWLMDLETVAKVRLFSKKNPGFPVDAALQLADGERTIREIHDVLRPMHPEFKAAALKRGFRHLERLGFVEIMTRSGS